MTIELLKVLIVLIAGGAAGALLNEFFRRRHAKTRTIRLIERVNRNPVSNELRGVKLYRQPGSPSEAPAEIQNLHEYQLTLKNTSDRDLRGAEIQFEFSSVDVEPWVSRAALSKTVLGRIEATPGEPWKKALRWRIPQFPPGDSVEFNFQVVDPSTKEYEAALYNIDNVILKRTQGEPAESSAFAWNQLALSLLASGLAIGVALSSAYPIFFPRPYRPLASFAPSEKSLEQLEIERIVTESQQFKLMNALQNPKGVDEMSLGKYWVRAEQGGTAIPGIIAMAQSFMRHNVRHGPESRSERFELATVRLLSSEFAKVVTSETWYLPVYRNGARVQSCSPNLDGVGMYELRKIDGRWLIQTDRGVEPADCTLTGEGTSKQ